MADFFAIQDLNQCNRKLSTSGGFISLLASRFMQEGYSVYGAAFDDSMSLRHMQIVSSEDLLKTRGSKYLQSDLREVFRSIKVKLLNGDKVLFVGTPCQIAGISSYLHNFPVNCENLMLIELKCYGVASPGLFKKYVESIENKYQAKINDIRFRDKEYGYSSTAVKVFFQGREPLVNNFYAKSFSKTFFSGNNVRPSCYKCCFRDYMQSTADFVVGDFHNIAKYDKKMDDDLGTSFVVALTHKANDCLKMIELDTRVTRLYDYKERIPGNPTIPASRQAFFQDSKQISWEKLVKRYCSNSLIDDMVYWLKPIIAKSPFKKYLFQLIGEINNLKYKIKTSN